MCGYNSDIRTIHEYCSKYGALKVEKDAQVCETAKICLTMIKAQKHILFLETKGHKLKTVLKEKIIKRFRNVTTRIFLTL